MKREIVFLFLVSAVFYLLFLFLFQVAFDAVWISLALTPIVRIMYKGTGKELAYIFFPAWNFVFFLIFWLMFTEELDLKFSFTSFL